MKLTDPPRARQGLCDGCLAGEHERCVDDQPDAETGRRRCVCQCSKVHPWPWPCAEDNPVLLLMANLERALEEAGVKP